MPYPTAPLSTLSSRTTLTATALCGLLLLGPLACGDDDPDRDGVAGSLDCEPNNPDIRPGAWERCDGLDNDCDGQVDELYDLDADGFLADDAGCRGLGVPVDCNDLDPAIHPEAEELPDSVDNDCDGAVDDSPDLDNDGFGAFDDCDDSDPFVNPDAAEVCDGVDNNCDGFIDPAWDEDGDGASMCAGDCDDLDPTRGPHLPEICDGIDNNCDGVVDEGFDQDSDGYTTCRGDCDDNNPASSPGLEEQCGDGIDNDCNPDTSETADLDNDGYTFCTGDCNDMDASMNPGEAEVCDGVDNDCSGFADDPLACWSCAGVSSYLICTNQVPFATARDACQAFGGGLVIMNDATENTNVSSWAWNQQAASYWIGLSDEAEEGVWRWVDDSLLSFSQWAAGEPNNSGNEDCVHTNFSGIALWNDLPCGASQPFICELP